MSANFAKLTLLLSAVAFVALAMLLRPSQHGRGAPRTVLRFAAIGTAAWALAASFGLLRPAMDVVPAAIWTLQLASLRERRPLKRPADRALVTAAMDTLRPSAATAWSGTTLMTCGIALILLATIVFFAASMVAGLSPAAWMPARGALLLTAVGLIALGASRMPDWSFGLVFSRQILIFAVAAAVLAAFAVATAVSTWQALDHLDEAQRTLWSAVASLLVLGLSLPLFWTTLLRRAGAFIKSHFYPQSYDFRREWLRFISTLSAPETGASLESTAIRAMSQIIDSPHGALWRRAECNGSFELVEVWPESGDRPGAAAVDAIDPLPEFLARSTWLIDLSQVRESPALYGGLRFDASRYRADADALIVPLLHLEQLYGWLVLARPPGLLALTFEDRDLLKTAGRQIALHLAQHDADARLAEARQFEAYNRMTAFLMHDLKNLAAQLRLVSQNAESHRRNPQFVDDAMRTISASAARMTRLIAQLSAGDAAESTTLADLADVAERAALRCATQNPVPQVIVLERPRVLADVERLGSAIEHAARNAQEATPENGEVRIEVGSEGNQPVVRIVDSGSGMDEAFIRDRLFRPFDTTKGTKGMGIGAFQIREYLRSIGGNVVVKSTLGSGTTFMLVFPRHESRVVARKAG
jgi:putative PEP-CTERM system histidine kinase